MGDFLEEAILDEGIKKGATYCDIRIGKVRRTSLEVKDGELKKASSGEEEGAGVRVLYNGVWGFFTINEISKDSLKTALRNALDMAKSGSSVARERVKIGPGETIKDNIRWKPKIDPFDVPIERKYKILAEMDSAIHEIEGVHTVTTAYSDGTIYTHFLNSEGSDIQAEITRTLAQVNLVAREGAKVIGYRGRVGGTCGFELFDMFDPVEKGVKVGESAVRVLKAKRSPSGRFPVVTDHDLTGVFVHEALGHATEGDIVTSGDSILEGQIGNKIAADNITIIDDSTLKNAFGSYPYDDEGVKGKRKILIQDGVLEGFILNRETAHKLGMESNGGARAESFAARPLVRMSNTYIDKGDYNFEEIFEDIKYGIYAKGTRGGEVDTAKGSFQFSAQEAFLIEKGEITTPLKDVSLSGMTLQILRNIDAVGNDLALGDPGFCGKGQLVPVGDGGPHIRIKEAAVG
ncbi:MAG: TldD/PmbA family protein [Methanomassiliicoccales archaeon]|nr:MAG: TldD/PmbA family protein [Methanomassiliicoccales archaeon]